MVFCMTLSSLVYQLYNTAVAGYSGVFGVHTIILIDKGVESTTICIRVCLHTTITTTTITLDFVYTYDNMTKHMHDKVCIMSGYKLMTA